MTANNNLILALIVVQLSLKFRTVEIEGIEGNVKKKTKAQNHTRPLTWQDRLVLFPSGV